MQFNLKSRYRLFSLLFAVTFPAAASAFVRMPCDLGDRPLARILANNQHVFVARILTLSWVDQFVGVPGAEAIDDPSGKIKATFQVLAVVKGHPEGLGTLDQVLYGNPNSFPYLKVSTDYLVFTNGSEISEEGCISRAEKIQYNSFPRWVERLNSGDPDAKRWGTPFR